MNTYAFIGSDKNAGKTTAFNFVYRLIHQQGRQAENAGQAIAPVCLTSIGINGETIDEYDGREKPEIRIIRGTYFVTADEHLRDRTGRYQIMFIFKGFVKSYVLAQCLSDFSVVLEGPNTGMELQKLKARLTAWSGASNLLIDGSIDRQFLARPDISDGFYFALLISTREPQLRKAHDLLFSLTLPVCDRFESGVIEKHRHQGTHALLFCRTGEKTRIRYHGTAIAVLDEKLREVCRENRQERMCLYLNGALSRALFNFLAPFGNLTIILDNFTLYQNILARQDGEGGQNRGRRFRPQLRLLHPVRTQSIFLRQENDRLRSNRQSFSDLFQLVPRGIPVHNLFREHPYEIGI